MSLCSAVRLLAALAVVALLAGGAAARPTVAAVERTDDTTAARPTPTPETRPTPPRPTDDSTATPRPTPSTPTTTEDPAGRGPPGRGPPAEKPAGKNTPGRGPPDLAPGRGPAGAGGPPGQLGGVKQPGAPGNPPRSRREDFDAKDLLDQFAVLRAANPPPLFPVTGYGLGNVNAFFGPREKIASANYDFHRGIDIDAPRGEPVVAVLDGFYQGAVVETGGGNIVRIRHLLPQPVIYKGEVVSEFYTLYLHLDSVAPGLNGLAVGQPVARGSAVGTVGDTGTNAIGVHLHFEVRVGTRCSLQFMLENPMSSCATHSFDPHFQPHILYPPPAQLTMDINIITEPRTTQDGIIHITMPTPEATVNRFVFYIVGTGTVANPDILHRLDFNERIGFNAMTNAALDIPDKTKPYIDPLPFQQNSPTHTVRYVIPKTVMNGVAIPWKRTLIVFDTYMRRRTVTWI